MKNFKWDKKYLYWGVTAFCVVLASILFFWLTQRWQSFTGLLGLMGDALAPFIYGILIAYLLNKAMGIFETHMFLPAAGKLFKTNPVKRRKAARIFSIIFVELLTIGVIAGLLVIMLPQIYYSVANLINRSSQYINIVVDWVERFMSGDTLEPVVVEWINEAGDYMRNWLENDLLPQMDTLLAGITGGVVDVVKAVFNMLVGGVISVYILYNKELFAAQAK